MFDTMLALAALAALCTVAPSFAVAADDPKDWRDLLEKRTFKGKKESLPYRLMKPADYDEKKKYPLVIFLHGAGERGNDNTKQLVHGVKDFAAAEARKKYPCFLIAPQCPTAGWWAGPRSEVVLQLIEEVKKEFSIDPARIYLTGLSMGGFGTWDLLARKPELFAAGIPICGGGEVKEAEKLVKIPIWVFHGDKDGAVKVELSRDMVAAIKKAGGEPKYTEYAGVGHDSWTKTYADPKVMAWLFEQKK